MSIFTYGIRVNKILKNENESAVFTPSEIVYAIVNLFDARKVLTREEYFFVSVVFETYRKTKKKLLLSKEGFLKLCGDIIAHFDLIGPYYKFCGDPRMKFMLLEEDEKQEYRKRAKEILKSKGIFGEEWMKLHQEFVEAFHLYE